jgi:hypothetical protein
MGQTNNLKLPYPESTDPPDGPLGFRNLAEKIDSLGSPPGTSRYWWAQKSGGGGTSPGGKYDDVAAATWGGVGVVSIPNALPGLYLADMVCYCAGETGIWVGISINGGARIHERSVAMNRTQSQGTTNLLPLNVAICIAWYHSGGGGTLTFGAEVGFSSQSVHIFEGSGIGVRFVGGLA